MAAFSIGLDLVICFTWFALAICLFRLHLQKREENPFSFLLFWFGLVFALTGLLRLTNWFDWDSMGLMFNPVKIILLGVSLKTALLLVDLMPVIAWYPAPHAILRLRRVNQEVTEALEASEKRFESICNNAPVGIFFYHEQSGEEAYPLFVNRYWQDLTGYDEGEFRQAPWSRMVHSDDQPGAREEWLRCLQEKQAFHREVRWVGKDGNVIWVDVGAVPMYNPENATELLGYAGILRDITLEKQQQQVMLEMTQRQEDLFGIVSHELRAPITNMKLAIKLLSLNATATNLVKYLNIMQLECDREFELINNLLDQQRLRSEEYVAQLEWFDLNTWLQNTVAPFLPRMEEKNLVFRADVGQECLQVKAFLERDSLTRILSELLNNACKYTPEGETISVRMHLLSKKRIRFDVTNTGVEIPPESLPRLFSRFYRVPSSLLQPTGSGLGLTLAEELCLRMKGTIKVESNRNQVSFKLVVPAKLE